MVNSGRKIIHKSIDDEGIIEVIDDYALRTRSLYFGTPSRQSCMHLDYPEILVLSYTQHMMSSLLFAKNPKSVLIVGLGGGSMAKFILQHYPDCKIKAIEKREYVKKIAHGYFNLPQTPNIDILIGDCSNILQDDSVQNEKYDAIFIDAFTGSDVSDSLTNQDIFDVCKMLLTKHGVLCINLWSKSPNYKNTLRLIKNSFNDFTFSIPTNEKRNIIHIAFPYRVELKNVKKMKADAAALAKKINLPVDRYLNAIIKHNSMPGKLLNKIW